MRGGIRNGSGRKTLLESQKKKSRAIYLSDERVTDIMKLSFPDATTFSQKCSKLIEIGLEHFSNHSSSVVAEPISTYEFDIAKNETSVGSRKKILKKEKTLTFIDLFAGIGGIRKGFEDDYTKCVFSSEWDQYAVKTYEANYGETPFGDITKISSEDIPNHDVLLAGFPCQPFSHIGRREGFAHETQGTLFFDVLRILQAKQPKMFLLENVKGLLTNDNGNTFRIIMNHLNSLNYDVFYKVLDAQDFGLPQRRERIIIVGFREDLQIRHFDFPTGKKQVRVPICDILERNPKGYTISKHLQENYLFKKNDGKPQLIDLDSKIQVNTLVASYHKIQRLTGTFIKDGETGVRLFSELELKRLMGFPDDFIVPVSRTQMYRQFGNSVAVPMIQAVAKSMKEALIISQKMISDTKGVI